MTTRYHLLTSAEAQIARVARSTCIAIIDESSPPPASLASDWTTFRTTYPLRPYFLIGVGGGTTTLNIPANMQSAILTDPLTRAFVTSNQFPGYSTTPKTAADAAVFPSGMPRDNGNVSLRSDLFTLCGLNTKQPGENVFLFVDDSGSMNVVDVRATLDLLQASCDTAGLKISSVFNPSENYILPFISFTGTPGVP